MFDVLPFVGTLVALGLLFYRPIGGLEIGLFFGMWLLTGLGLTVGYHRLFTHRAFSTGTAVSCLLIVMGSMAGRGPMLSWVAMHRRHHELSDHDGDLHSPNLHGATALGRLRGFLHAHLTWMIEHDYPNVAHYVPDLMAERTLLAVNRYYYHGCARLADSHRDRRACHRQRLGRAIRISLGRRRAHVRGRAVHVGDQFGDAHVSARDRSRPATTTAAISA